MKNHFFTLKTITLAVAAILSLNACVKTNNDQQTIDPAETYTPPNTTTQPTNTDPPTYNYASLSDSLQLATYTTFLSSNRLYFNTNNRGNADFYYQPNAVMTDVLADGYERTRSVDYAEKLMAHILGIKGSCGDTNFFSAYFDAMGYMGSAAMRSYVLLQNRESLLTAKKVYAGMKLYLNNNAGGGVNSTKAETWYKRAAPTASMCILVARIYKLERNADDFAVAKKLYDWLKTTLVLPTGEVLDGINAGNVNNGVIDNSVYSHNQGLFIGAAVEMYNVTGDKSYLQDAITTGNNSLTDPKLISNGSWKTEGQGAGGMYKGMLARYLTQLALVSELDVATAKSYTSFIQKNARMLYYQGIARPSLMISPDWSIKPGTSTDFTTQLSGIAMMEAAAKLKGSNRID